MTTEVEDFKWPIKDVDAMDALLAKLDGDPKLKLKLVNSYLYVTE